MINHVLTKAVTVLCIWGVALNVVAATANVLPKESRVPGGVAIIDLGAGQHVPEVRYLGHRALVMRSPSQPSHWLTVIGIPMATQPGAQHIDITINSKSYSQVFTVNQKKYPTVKLKITNQRISNPSAADYELIAKQYTAIIDTYATWHDSPLNALTLALPVKGKKSSPFGLTRIMNNKIAKDPHSGLDIAAIIGTPVRCPRSGTVLHVGNFFYNGNTVFIDHGQGFITSYCHLDTINVDTGQPIKTGEILGTVGKTGRVTGPHLHWSVSLNGVRVDPQLFIHE